MRKKLTTVGARGLLKLLGGLATLAATACAAYGALPEPPDATLGGADAAYGPPVSIDATLPGEDAGTDEDAGQ